LYVRDSANTVVSCHSAVEAKIAELKTAAANADAAKVVAAMIAALGAIDDITAASEGAVQRARTAYGVLSPAQQALVGADADKITAAEAKIAALKAAAADKAAIDAAIARIDAIPATVTGATEFAITLARTVYDKLTPAQKEEVTNSAALTAVEAALDNLMTGIVIVKKPTKTVYEKGEEPNWDGLEVSMVTRGGKLVAVDLSKCTVTDFYAEREGNVTIRVTYEGSTAAFTVTILAQEEEGGCAGGAGTLFDGGFFIMMGLLGALVITLPLLGLRKRKTAKK